MTTFEQERWPLHYGLAWLLYKNHDICKKVRPHSHACRPGPLWPDGYTRDDEPTNAWKHLRSLMAAGTVRVWQQSAAHAVLVAAEGLAEAQWSYDDLAETITLVVGESELGDVTLSGPDLVTAWADREPIGEMVTEANISAPDAAKGYMSMTDAAAWIATEGGVRPFLMFDTSVWLDAFHKLTAAVSAGEVEAIGAPSPNQMPAPISRTRFANLTVDPPYSYGGTELELIFGAKPYLRAGALGEISDELHEARAIVAYALQVDRAAVAKAFPFTATLKSSSHKNNMPPWEAEVSTKPGVLAALQLMVKVLEGNDFPAGYTNVDSRIAHVMKDTNRKADRSTFGKAFKVYENHRPAIREHCKRLTKA